MGSFLENLKCSKLRRLFERNANNNGCYDIQGAYNGRFNLLT